MYHQLRIIQYQSELSICSEDWGTEPDAQTAKSGWLVEWLVFNGIFSTHKQAISSSTHLYTTIACRPHTFGTYMYHDFYHIGWNTTAIGLDAFPSITIRDCNSTSNDSQTAVKSKLNRSHRFIIPPWPRPIGGGIKRLCCLTSVCLTSVCLSVCLSIAYIGPKSRTERPRKTKVAHITRDSDTTFKVTGAGVYCGALPHSFLKYEKTQKTLKCRLPGMLLQHHMSKSVKRHPSEKNL